MPKPESTLPENQVMPDSQLEKHVRCHFSTAYKLRILAEAGQCAHGELGPLLRREKLYSNQLNAWRKELAKGGEAVAVINTYSRSTVLEKVRISEVGKIFEYDTR